MTDRFAPYAIRLATVGRVADEHIARQHPDPVERTLSKMLRSMLGMADKQESTAGLSAQWETLELSQERDEQRAWSEYRMLIEAAPVAPLTGLTIRMAPMLRDGKVISMRDVVLIGTHPLTELEAAGREARLAVRRGLADVLEWLGQTVNNEPTGAEVHAALRNRAAVR